MDGTDTTCPLTKMKWLRTPKCYRPTSKLGQVFSAVLSQNSSIDLPACSLIHKKSLSRQLNLNSHYTEAKCLSPFSTYIIT